MLASATVAQSNLATNVAGNGPAFFAYLSSNQTVSSGVSTKITLNATSYNVGGFFDTTNYRFFPTVAGYYQINFGVQAVGASINVYVQLVDNAGGIVTYGNYVPTNGTNPITTGTSLVYFNGTSTFIYLYAVNNGGTTIQNGSSLTYMSGSLVRAG
jgi:hypothetical protein